jgi:2-polyprenyl-6-methoxyphenol hydroxylase-like FAD-dependent oxidoreductase
MWRIVADNPPADWRDEPTLEQCQSFVDQRVPTRVTLRDPRWLARVRIHRRTTPHMQMKRVFLLGDAAHNDEANSLIEARGEDEHYCVAVAL